MTWQSLYALFGIAVVIVLALVFPEFINLPALVLTVGGACAVTACSYSRNDLLSLAAAIQRLLGDSRREMAEHLAELSRLTRLYRLEGLKGIENQEPQIVDPFLRRGVGLLVDLDSEERVLETLRHELLTIRARHQVVQQILSMLGKTLPAFGLIGTLIGMVLLLRPQDGPESASLPAALSVAVLTTLYGAATANIIVTPLAARLRAAASAQEQQMEITLDWVATLIRGEAMLPPQRPGSRPMIAVNAHAAMANKTWPTIALPHA